MVKIARNSETNKRVISAGHTFTIVLIKFLTKDETFKKISRTDLNALGDGR